MLSKGDVLIRISVILVEQESVGFGQVFLLVICKIQKLLNTACTSSKVKHQQPCTHLQMRVVAFVNKELTVCEIPVLACIFQHVAQLSEKLIAPVLRLIFFIAIPAVLVANDIAICPPLVDVWDNILPPVVLPFLAIVRRQGAVRAVDRHVLSPVVDVAFVCKGRKNHHPPTTDHHKNAAPHVEEQIVQRMNRRLAVRLLVEGQVHAVVDALGDGKAFVPCKAVVRTDWGRGPHRVLEVVLFDLGEEDFGYLLPVHEQREDVLELGEVRVRAPPAVAADKGLALGLGRELGHATGGLGHDDATPLRSLLVLERKDAAQHRLLVHGKWK